jgi:hypothetical protein
MATYGFDLIGNDGLSRGVDLGEFATDMDATRHAKSALATSFTAAAVEVWNGDERVARIARGIPTFPIPTEPKRFYRRPATGATRQPDRT